MVNGERSEASTLLSSTRGSSQSSRSRAGYSSAKYGGVSEGGDDGRGDKNQRWEVENGQLLPKEQEEDDVGGSLLERGPIVLTHLDHLAIPISYFCVGFLASFVRTPLNVFMVNTLNLQPGEQNTIYVLMSIPWSFKLVHGFISDIFPIAGLRRKPYLVVGFGLHVVCYLALGGLAHLGLITRTSLAVLLFTATLGQIMGDVMSDTLVVERSAVNRKLLEYAAAEEAERLSNTSASTELGSSLESGTGTGEESSEVASTCSPSSPSTRSDPLRGGEASPLNSSGSRNMNKTSTNLSDAQSDGQLQGTCYAIRFAGSVVGCLGGALLYNRRSWGWGLDFDQVCALNAMVPLLLLAPAAWFLYEERGVDRKSVQQQCQDVWTTIQLKAVWKPMTFIYLFNLFQIPNAAWGSFLQLGLHFQAYQLGFMATAGAITTMLGVLAYKRYLFHVSWRLVYAWSVIITTLFSLLQLVLVFRLNHTWWFFHVPDFWFALGDDVISEYVQGIQFLPVCIMYMHLCPGGSEGATYSMLTTFGNIALVCAGSLGTLMASLWDVSNQAIEAGDFTGIWKLTVLTSVVAPLPLVLLGLLPATQADQEHLKVEKQTSRLGGACFLTVLGLSLAWVFGEAMSVVFSESEGGAITV